MSSERRPSPRPTPRTTVRPSSPQRSQVASRSARSVGRPAAAAATATAPREQVAPERPSLELVEARRSRRRLRIAGIATFGLVFGSLLGLAVFHSVLVQSQLRLDKIDARISEEQDRQNALRLQVAQLGAPERIISAAGEQGMVPPDDRKFLAAVVPGTVVPAPATTKAPTTSKAPTTTKVPTTKTPAPSATTAATNGAAR
jgi:cell division protein FtsL